MKNIVLSFLLFFPAIILAATSDFNIKVNISDDITPPSTPTLLSATPTAATQIDIAWSTSTDNRSVGGYVILRDGSGVATTSSSTNFYNDAGLTPETLYTYSVYAFDTTYNISSTSNSIATTTLALPPSPISTSSTSTTSSGTQSTKTVKLKDIFISTGINEVTFTWNTYGQGNYILRWGKDDRYNEGYVSSDVYKDSHRTNLVNLKEDTLYQYELVAGTPLGADIVLKRGQFKTMVLGQEAQIPNVRYLTAVADGDHVRLSWTLPLFDVESIRIVRSNYGYPVDPNDGVVVYEGLGDRFFDKDAFLGNTTQYYSVFVMDKERNFSSGAVVKIEKEGSKIITNPSYSNEAIKKDDVRDGGGTTTADVKKELLLTDFERGNIVIIQNGDQNTFETDRIFLSYSDPFTISIKKDTLPDNLKTIIVTLIDPTNHRREYSFLLKLNSDKTQYEAVIAPLNVVGSSRLEVQIFDFEKNMVGLYQKQTDFVDFDKEGEEEVFFPDKLVYSFIDLSYIWVGLFIVVIAIITWWWFINKRKDEDK